MPDTLRISRRNSINPLDRILRIRYPIIMRYLNVILFIAICVLLVFAVLALIEIHWRLKDMQFACSPEGIEYYLASLGKYKYLFAGTVATCSAYFGLLSVKARNESNADKKKQDRFNEWKMILQLRSSDILDRDPMIVKYITEKRNQIFNYLHDIQFKFDNKEQLTIFFNLFFKDQVGTFEIHNFKYKKLSAIYPNSEFSYSFESFCIVFFVMIESWYNEVHSDILKLYIDNLPENRIINEQSYKDAIESANSMFVSLDNI